MRKWSIIRYVDIQFEQKFHLKFFDLRKAMMQSKRGDGTLTIITNFYTLSKS